MNLACKKFHNVKAALKFLQAVDGFRIDTIGNKAFIVWYTVKGA